MYNIRQMSNVLKIIKVRMLLNVMRTSSHPYLQLLIFMLLQWKLTKPTSSILNTTTSQFQYIQTCLLLLHAGVHCVWHYNLEYESQLDDTLHMTLAAMGGGLLFTVARSSTMWNVTVTKVTFHLPPIATHLLGEWTLPSHALVLCSSEALHLF